MMEKFGGVEVAHVELRDDLRYSSAEFLKDKITKMVNKNPNIQIVVIGGDNIYNIDSTVGLVSCFIFFFRMPCLRSEHLKS